MRTTIRIVSGIALAAAVVSTAQGANAQVSVQYLSSSRHDNITFSDTQVQDMFNQATNLLLADSDGTGTEDVACQLGFERLSNITTFSLDGNNDDGDIDSKQELEYVLVNAPAYVNVVSHINYCQGAGVYAGCSNFIRMIIERERALSAARGTLMTHEFGHTVELEYHVLDERRAMYERITANGVRVTQAECAMFRMSPLSFNGGPIGGLPEETEADFSDVPIEQLATQGFVDSIPVEVEDYYDQSDVALLKEMLTDPDQVRNARTILSLIGLISDGSAADVDAIVDYAKAAPGDEHQRTGIAAAAGMALGYLANRTGNAGALEHVVAMSKSADGGARQGGLFGLALSGTTRGRSELSALKRVAGRVAERVLDQAAEEGDLVSVLGLRGYYARARH